MVEDPFQLRQLPAHQPPAKLWAAIDRQLAEPAQASATHRSLKRWLPGAAVAAALLVAVTIYWQQARQTAPSMPVAQTGRDHTEAVSMAALQRTSSLLQSRLYSMRNGVIRGHDLAAMALLQSELRLTDDLLSEQPHNRQLWQQRNAVLATMAEQYQADDWLTQIQLASY